MHVPAPAELLPGLFASARIRALPGSHALLGVRGVGPRSRAGRGHLAKGRPNGYFRLCIPGGEA